MDSGRRTGGDIWGSFCDTLVWTISCPRGAFISLCFEKQVGLLVPGQSLRVLGRAHRGGTGFCPVTWLQRVNGALGTGEGSQGQLSQAPAVTRWNTACFYSGEGM